MAIPTFVNVETARDSSVDTLDVSITIGSESDSVLLGWASIVETAAGGTISSIVLDPGGVDEASFTFEGAINNDASVWARTEVWYLLDPPEGTFTVRFTATEGITRFIVAVEQISGVDQTDPIGATGTATGTGDAGSVNVTTTEESSLVSAADTIYSTSNTQTAGTDDTERWDLHQQSLVSWGGDTDAATTGTYTVSRTDDGSTSADWAMLGVEVLAAAAAAERRPEMVRPVMQPRPIRQLRI